MNIALGLIGGTLGWALVTAIQISDQTLASFLSILAFGGICGAILTCGLASLRNILRSAR